MEVECRKTSKSMLSASCCHLTEFLNLTQPFFIFQVGVKNLVVFINKADIVDDEMLELVELEMMELLDEFGFNGEKTPIVKGSARLALEGDQGPFGEPSIHKLINALDTHIKLGERDVTSPFLMPIDNIISVPGRGTVVIGTVKRKKAKQNEVATLAFTFTYI